MKMQYNATAPTVVDNTTVDAQASSRGELLVRLSSGGVPATSSVDNLDGVAVSSAAEKPIFMSRNTIYNGTSWDRERKSSTVARLLSAAASTNATSVKATAGDVFKMVGVNTNAAARYLKLYNKASAPTVGTDTPIATLYLPPSTVDGGRFEYNFGAQPHYFSLGIAYALTTAAADADTGALTAGDVIAFNLFYT